MQLVDDVAPNSWALSLEKGVNGEIRIARYLEAAGYSCTPTGWYEGSDRSFTAPDLKVTAHATNPAKHLVGKSVEIKTDSRAHETGNCVIELFSNVPSGRLGWALTCEADVIVYLIADSGECIMVDTAKMKAALAKWRGKFTAVENDTFWGLSMLVPLDSLRKLAFHVGVAA